MDTETETAQKAFSDAGIDAHGTIDPTASANPSTITDQKCAVPDFAPDHHLAETRVLIVHVASALPRHISKRAKDRFPFTEPPKSAEDNTLNIANSCVNGRIPSDYTLARRLLASPCSRWVECRTCSKHFVQTDAYTTRSACPRCERHSKLYGFAWPKTDKVDRDDPDESVLDHRTINRFVYPTRRRRLGKGRDLH